jgi:DNA helicase II / ATP-dependent DNA helicase PcrA
MASLPPDGLHLRTLRPRDLVPPSSTSPEGPALNAAQAAAAAHGDGPLLIVAGAGSGKTRTLVHRVAALVERGVAPERILLLTFTRRAAQEMLDRAERLAGAARRVQGGTFHGIAHRILRRFGPAAGLPRDFSIMDASDASDLMGIARTALGYGEPTRRRGADEEPAGPARRFPRAETCLTLYSRQVNTDRPVYDLLEEGWPHFAEWAGDLELLFVDYVRRKTDANLLDYDDLLLSLALLLEQGGDVGDRIRAEYDHVLVDEYQDTNPLQARILRALCPHGRLTVVGDDAQSIYAFRGATIHNIMQFPAQFADTTIITLEQNYRSSAPILHTSNTLISRATVRYTKQLWTERTDGELPWLVTVRDEREQTRFIVDRLLELHETEGIPLREIAVLVRAGYLSADLEVELANRRIPYEKWGGLKFLEAAHIKDVLAFLRLLENPQDEVSWFRLLRLLPGVGDRTARAAIESLAARGWQPLALMGLRVSTRAAAGLAALGALLEGLRSAPRAAVPAEEIQLVRRFYDRVLMETYDDPQPRLADLDQLTVIASGYATRTELLAALALEPPAATQDLAVGADDEDTDALIISTVHSAKGREWDAVFVPWTVDGVYPMARSANQEEAVEEERRLLYVAMTRARHHLCLIHPLQSFPTRMSADYSYGQLSRFLDDGVRRTMQRVTLGPDGSLSAAPLAPLPPRPPVDLRALLRGRVGLPAPDDPR